MENNCRKIECEKKLGDGYLVQVLAPAERVTVSWGLSVSRARIYSCCMQISMVLLPNTVK